MARIAAIVIDPDAMVRDRVDTIMRQHGAALQHVIHYPHSVELQFILAPATDTHMLNYDLDRNVGSFRGRITGSD